jgi:hypothetical protein
MVNYTIEFYKKDGRKKEGKRLISTMTMDAEEYEIEDKVSRIFTPFGGGLSWEIHETWRQVMNVRTGVWQREHYKIPYSCSVASEAYWSS